MSTIFVIHGVEGHPAENWFPWLKSELENLGHTVFVLAFPTPHQPNLMAWLSFFKRYEKDLGEDSIVIGHSLGALFLLHILEQHRVKAFFSVAGFGELPGNAFDERMKTFAKNDFAWERIRANCAQSYVFHGDNDPYVRPETADALARHLEAELILVKEGGHFNTAAGYTKFDLLLKTITSAFG